MTTGRIWLGPMAAVAGAIAQNVGRDLLAYSNTVIIENGGDIYICAVEPVIIGLKTGTADLADRRAFSLEADDTPVSICSSSGKMGHSMSLGECDLATVVAKDTALADAAATQAANLVRNVDDIDSTLENIAGIEGVDSVMIIKGARVGLAGKLPPLVRIK